MDYEEIFDPENTTSLANDSSYVYRASSAEIALECFKFLTCFIGTSVDILMIVIIGKYKNMQKPLNIYIMNWLICDALFILIDPAEYRIYTIMRGFDSDREVLCVLFTCVMVIRLLDIMFMILLLLQWFFERTKIEVFERHCYKIVAGVWIFGLADVIFEVIACSQLNYFYAFADIFAVCAMFLLLISVSIIHCMRRCANPFNDSKSLSIALITSFILSWICVIFVLNLFRTLNHVVFRIVLYSGQVLVYFYPLLMFYLFYKLDPMFAVCVRLLFRLTKPEEATATFEELDEAAENAAEV